VVAYRRTQPGFDSFTIVANLSDGPGDHGADGPVVVGTDHSREGAAFDGHLGAWEAVVVKAPDRELRTTNR
jgi:hypothetical protein